VEEWGWRKLRGSGTGVRGLVALGSGRLIVLGSGGLIGSAGPRGAGSGP